MKTLLALGGLFVALRLATVAEAQWPSSGSWAFAGTMANQNRLEQTTTLLTDGTVLVAGGGTSDAEIFDPSTFTWTATGSMSASRQGSSAVLLPNGKVLVAGGFSLSSAEIYDPSTGTWTTTGSMSTIRVYAMMTLLPNGLVLIASGSTAFANPTPTAELYDPSTGVWTLTGSLASGREDGGMVLLPDGRVLAAGGTYGAGNLSSAEIYEPTSGTWSSTGTLNTGRSWYALNVLPNGQVLAAGGLASNSSVYLDSAELYDPVAGSWTTTGSMTAACAFVTGTLLPTAQTQIPSNAVGWWPGNGNANDVIGSHNGTLNGGATDTNLAFVGQGFTFDGTNSYVQITDAAALKPTNLTVEAWVRFDSLDSQGSGGSPAGQQYIVFKQNTRSSDFEGYYLAKERRTGGDIFVFEVSSSAGANAEVDSSMPIYTNVWYHIAGVRGSNFVALYVNGQSVGQTSVSFPQNYGSHPLYFGTSGQSYWDHKFCGTLDEVALYNRALSSSEILGIYAAGSAGKTNGAVTPSPLNGKVLVAASSTDIYNWTSGIWSSTNGLTYGDEDHTQTLLQNGDVLTVGGFFSNPPEVFGGP